MVPLPGNRRAPATRNLADQLATIAAKLDSVLASLRDDIEEIKVQLLGDDNTEEPSGYLKNTVEEEAPGSEHDPLPKIGSGIDGVNKIGGDDGIPAGFTDRNDVIESGNGGAGEIGDKIDEIGGQLHGIVDGSEGADGVEITDDGITTGLDINDDEIEDPCAMKKSALTGSFGKREKEGYDGVSGSLSFIHIFINYDNGAFKKTFKPSMVLQLPGKRKRIVYTRNYGSIKFWEYKRKALRGCKAESYLSSGPGGIDSNRATDLFRRALTDGDPDVNQFKALAEQFHFVRLEDKSIFGAGCIDTYLLIEFRWAEI